MSKKLRFEDLICSKITMEIMVVDSVLAERVMKERNPRNRPGNAQRSRRYARDMRAGVWIVTHQGIAFDVNGNLIDGQTRLSAIILAGVPIVMMVTRGLPEKVTVKQSNGKLIEIVTQDVVDGNRVRSAGNQGHLSLGLKHANLVFAALKQIQIVCGDGLATQQTIAQKFAALEIYRKDIEAIIETGLARGDLKGPIVGGIAMAHAAWPAKAIQFCEQLTQMDGLPKGSPVIALRKWIIAHATSGRRGATQADRVDWLRVAVTAVVKFADGEAAEKITPSESHMEKLRASQKANVRKIREILELDGQKALEK